MWFINFMRAYPAFLLVVSVCAQLFAGCASSPPPRVREAPPGSPALADARHSPQSYFGRAVRWGGTVATVENRAAETWVEVVSRELDSRGRPRDTDRTEGRFLARVTGFLDPAVYAAGRQVTAVGTVTDVVTRPIGEHPYVYVVLKAETLHLWDPLPELPAEHWRHDPFWRYPWNSPCLYPNPYCW